MEKYNRTEENRIRRGTNRGTYNKEEIFKIIHAGFMAQVSFIVDGTPMSLPMAYGVIDDKLYFHGAQTNRTLASILKQNRVSVNITHLDGLVLAKSGLHHSVNYRSVTLFGTVKNITNNDLKNNALKEMINLMINDRWDTLRPMTPSEMDRTKVVEFTIETGSAKIRNTGVVDEKSDAGYPTWAGVIPLKTIAQYPVQEPDNKENLPEHIINYMNQFGD